MQQKSSKNVPNCRGGLDGDKEEKLGGGGATHYQIKACQVPLKKKSPPYYRKK
jgi:hypothetical protein